MIDDFPGHANRWYLDALLNIIETGDKVTTRGRTTWEKLHQVTRLTDPRKRVLTVPFRRANPFFQALETVWILAGRSDAGWLTYYNSQMGKFLDDDQGQGYSTKHFHGAYGERLISYGSHLRTNSRMYFPTRNQIQDVITQLRQEPTSRRAVMTIHNPWFDNPDFPTLDRPCNIAMSYQLRNGKLHAVTFNRSNDLNLGLAFTNICQFTTIQEFIAAALGVDVGEYVHFSSSLHVYEDDPVVKRLMHPVHVMGPVQEAPLEEIVGPALAPLVRPGQVARWSDSQVIPPAKFDVYDHFQPTPMWKWPVAFGGDGWDYIKALEYLGKPDWRPANDEFPDIPCPYWSSVEAMARAWYHLKRTDEKQTTMLCRAMIEILGMRAKDWQVACLEFVHRWAVKRELEAEFLGYFDREPFSAWPGPVREFVSHDKGDV